MSQVLAAGTVAPDFTLRVTPDQNLSLSDLLGRPVVLAFYPADWSPVCGDQMALYNEVLPEFQKHHAVVLGISVDGVWCHEAFAKDRHLHFPLLADFHPKGAVAKKYGAYRESEGVCERALFVIDAQGVIFWSCRSPIAVNPGADGILDALERMARRSPRMGTLRVPVTPHEHIKGPADAPLTLVEYGDYECPHCAAAHSIVNQVLDHFGPRVRFVFRHFPLTQVHPLAEPAAETAEFAAAHGRFWEMHDGLYENQDRLSPALLLALARALELSEQELANDLENQKYAAKVRADFASGVRSGVNGTPSFFINGRQHEGSYAFDELVAALEHSSRDLRQASAR